MQQGARLVKKSNAVVRQVQQRHQRVAVHIVNSWPQPGGEHTVRRQKQRQRRHQAVHTAAHKAHVVHPAMGLHFLQQQRSDQKAAQDEKNIHAIKSALEQRRMGVREDHQEDGDPPQAVQRTVVRQAHAGRCAAVLAELRQNLYLMKNKKPGKTG